MPRTKESEGPTLSTVLILGLITFFIGAALGTISLISRPVTTHRTAPDPEKVEPGEVVFIRGDRGGRTAWRAKEAAWKSGQVDRLILTESELNQWSRERLVPGEPPSAEKDAPESSWWDTFEVSVSAVDFRILEDRIQLSTEVGLPGLVPQTTFIYQTLGRLEAGEDGLVFKPETGNLGKAPLGSVPLSRSLLFGFLKGQFEALEAIRWLEASLEAIESVDVSEGRLTIERADRS